MTNSIRYSNIEDGWLIAHSSSGFKSEKLECFLKRYVRFLERRIKENEVVWEWYIRRLGMI